MNGHVLVFRIGMGPGMAACSRCKRMLSIEEIVAEACTGPVTVDAMLDYLDQRLGDRPRRMFEDGSGYEILDRKEVLP